MNIVHKFETILNQQLKHDAPKVIVNNFTSIFFAKHTISAVQKFLKVENPELNVEALNNVDVTVFDEAAYETLVAVKKETGTVFSNIVTKIQGHYRTSDKLAKQYVAIRDSRNGHTQKSQERLAIILTQQEHEYQEASSLKPALMSAMRVEHAMRGIPWAYKTGNIEDYFNVFKLATTIEYTRNSRDFLNSYLKQFTNDI